MTFWLTESGSHSGKTNVWLTPKWLLELFGPFDLDPCSQEGYKTAWRHLYERDNGLYAPWSGLVYCNPPYGTETAHWVERWITHPDGLLLVANRSDTTWWQSAAKNSDAAWFPKGRINFLNSDFVEVKGTAFSSVLFARGSGVERLNRAKHLGVIANFQHKK